MARKKKTEQKSQMPEVVNKTLSAYQAKLDSDVKYSLDVDPTNKYNMSDEQKQFISYYVQFKSIPFAATMAHIENEKASEYFVAYSSQQEIRRINLALYARQFSKKMLSIEEIGGWLSSLLTDEDVPLADRLSTKDKLGVAKMILDLHDKKANGIANPEDVTVQDVESKIKTLSLETIKQLIKSDTDLENKSKVIQKITGTSILSAEETALLESLSYEELLIILNKINGGT